MTTVQKTNSTISPWCGSYGNVQQLHHFMVCDIHWSASSSSPQTTTKLSKQRLVLDSPSMYFRRCWSCAAILDTAGLPPFIVSFLCSKVPPLLLSPFCPREAHRGCSSSLSNFFFNNSLVEAFSQKKTEDEDSTTLHSRVYWSPFINEGIHPWILLVVWRTLGSPCWGASEWSRYPPCNNRGRPAAS